ncbi:MAG TPA: glycoside hydrolase TIM-barrel-like domain-containing protein [Devosiaceae bacterium]
MATLALSLAGQFAGGLVGGPVGATIGRALGALAGNAVDNALFGSHDKPAGADIRVQNSADGAPIPRLYGWNRVAGNIIWATDLERLAASGQGGKGLSSGSGEVIAASFAVGLCEGEVAHLGRIWADGQLLEAEGLEIRFHAGSKDQMPDSLIEAIQGTAMTPAYRGLCYLVFERLPLDRFGNRIPNITVELCRVAGDLEPAIQAINVIPGATEFGYDPVPRVRVVSRGVTAVENTHIYQKRSDWDVSIDQLTALCPNLENVSLVVAWFGDDLRCSTCTVRPRVEAASRKVKNADWHVAGLSRLEAQPVSIVEGGPAYGGTPSDQSVVAAIADLKARGLKVTLYPIVLMDIPPGNTLADPEAGTPGQPSYPWRGRITSDPAPGQAGTPDLSAAIDAQVAAFFGSTAPGDFGIAGGAVTCARADDWGYRRMVLHYAQLAGLAGGVDGFIIASEMKGLTTLRRSPDQFPAVEALCALAADARAILGPDTAITYAADWSEYSGYQPPDAPGDKLFHLDALWAHADIDAIGIDNYLPITDWRDGETHRDRSLAASPYDPAYLAQGIAEGEYFDWYYASAADRDAQVRTPIEDDVHGEPWIWRAKDIASWWSLPHHNRIGGNRSMDSTAFVPESKPIWFTELGCGAVDKGANDPAAFADAKSVEDRRPPFSSGAPDPLQQRQFLRAHFAWWRPDAEGFDEARNPVSAIYGGRMVDPRRICCWAWDARPFPAFPALTDNWADGANYATGHWLNGRLGALAVDELARAVARDHGVSLSGADVVGPLVAGLAVEAQVSARDALADLLDLTGLAVRDRPEGLHLLAADTRSPVAIDADAMVRADGPLASLKRPDASERISRLALSYADRMRDYLTATATAQALRPGSARSRGSALVLDSEAARAGVEVMLGGLETAADGIEFRLPPSRGEIEVGDTIAVAAHRNALFTITGIHDGDARHVSAAGLSQPPELALTAEQPGWGAAVAPAASDPVIVAACLPATGGGPDPARVVVGAFADPWPGVVSIADKTTGSEVLRLTQPGYTGVLTADLAPGPGNITDRASVLSLRLDNGHLASVSPEAVLLGANRIAVRNDAGAWEVVGFEAAELVGPSAYRLTGLLRRLGGSAEGTPAIASAGNPALVLDGRAVSHGISADQTGAELDLVAFAGPGDAEGAALVLEIGMDLAIPLAPCHLDAVRDPLSGDISISFIRRSRVAADGWAAAEVPLDFSPEAYRVTIARSESEQRVFDTAGPMLVYSAADQIADFGTLPGAFDYSVAQTSPVYGSGHAAHGHFVA